MRVVVFGGRDYGHPSDRNPNWRKERNIVYATLDSFHAHNKITVLIEGEADGADKAAKAWANSKNIPVEPYEADWDRYDKAAGMIRNRDMLVKGKPDWGIAFPGGKGTAGMLAILRKAKVPVLVIPR